MTSGHSLGAVADGLVSRVTWGFERRRDEIMGINTDCVKAGVCVASNVDLSGEKWVSSASLIPGQLLKCTECKTQTLSATIKLFSL